MQLHKLDAQAKELAKDLKLQLSLTIVEVSNYNKCKEERRQGLWYLNELVDYIIYMIYICNVYTII